MKAKALLVSMPWAPYQEPSLGLAILSATLNKVGIENEVRQFNVYLLGYLKASSYQKLADMLGINEFLFSYTFEKDISAEQIINLDKTISLLMGGPNEIPTLKTRADYLEYFLKIRNEIIPKYLKECANKIVNSNCTLLGLTCMFDQTIASLAVAKLVKSLKPDIKICMGGYALEGVVGEQIVNRFNFIDAIVQGDGEPAIVELAKYSIAQQTLSNIPNIIYVKQVKEDTLHNVIPIVEIGNKIKDTKHRHFKTERKKVILDETPTPDFSHFFNELDIFEAEHLVKITPSVLPIESSRGCWWGQKSHCTFCGIDENTLIYRQKSPQNAISMFKELQEANSTYTYRLSDYIIPKEYFDSVLPALSDFRPKLKISCEMKSNTSKKHFSLLASAGFVQVQPGIESFSTPVLKKMKKGVTGIQNILTLKLGKENGIKIDWNFLYGFPSDKLYEYEVMLKVMPMLYHLDPPNSCDNVLITRFAPLHENPEKFGIEKAKPHFSYETIFSEDYRLKNQFKLEDYCYIFQPNWDNGEDLELLYKLLKSQIFIWKQGVNKSSLCHKYHYLGITFTDGRYSSTKPKEISLSKAHSSVYKELEFEIRSQKKLISLFKYNIGVNNLNEILKELVDLRLIYQEDNNYVGLSLEMNKP
jgi:ribosomal peptide maturation radical SAM protein 1